jgi:uncharacterized protein YjdB
MAATLTCLRCGGDLGPGDRYCAQCGTAWAPCAVCSRPLLESDRSCPDCGAQAAPILLPDPVPVAPSPWDEMVERLRRATAGDFEIGPELGRGGMAAVFLAHDLALDRQVAIKVMSPAVLLGDGMTERFRQEAVTIARLHHPHIVPVYAVRHGEGLHYFVMRYVRGRSLDQVIQRAGRLPLPIVRSILWQVAAGLTYAHRSGVVHRDIKPANILIDEDGDAVVTDFGIAKAAERPSQTQSGALVGTPAYMSPEQCRGGDVSWASDQYALGAVAYEMITGSPPFEGSTFTVMQAHVERAPRPPAELRTECDPDLEAAILRMLAKERSARFPKMADAMTALGAAPLADGDPLRDELSRLVAPGEPGDAPAASSPASATGRGRSSGRWSMSGHSVGGISILPAPAGLEAGDSFMLVAVIRGQQGTRLPPRAVEWASDDPAVLRIDPGGTTATALAPGSATLSASSKGVSARHRVEVAPPRADEIDIAPADEPLRVGDEIRLETTARDKRGWPVQRAVTWRSDDPSVAEVTPDGSIAGQAPGTVRLTCFLDDAEASIVLPVLPPKVAVVVLGEAPATVSVGGTFLLTATALDRRNQPLVRRGISWTSSDGAVAVVTAEGWVAAVRPGTAVVTASCEGASASVHLTVTERSVVPAPAPPPRAEPVLRRRSRRSRRRRIATGILGAFAIGAGAWGWLRFSPDAAPETAAVPAGPAVSALAESDSSPPAASAPAELVAQTTAGAVTPPSSTVPAVAAVSILIPPALRVGDSLALRAVALGASGDTLLRVPIRWQSDDDGVVSIDPASGVARALGPGTAIVRARGGRRSAFAELTVLPAAVATLQILGARPVAVGEMLSLHTRAVDSWGKEVDGRMVTWASADSSVVAVDPASGVLTARAPGLTHVTAAVEGVTARVPLTVMTRPAPLGSNGDRTDAVVAAALRKGVEECYGALRGRDLERIAALYRPTTKSDQETLKRLTRQLRAGGGTSIGQRADLGPEIHTDKAAAEFAVDLSWVDGSGNRRRAQPLFRAEFDRQDAGWVMTACRIVGTSGL